MRGTLIPRKSAAHKLACLRLYRNLLRECIRFSTPVISTSLVKLVRHRFHQDAHIQSPSIVCDALRQGRQAHWLLKHAANGSPTACAELVRNLEEIASYTSELGALRTHQASLRSPTRPSKLAKMAHFQNQRSKEWAERIPNPIPIAVRPVPKEALPKPEKARRVPILVHAQGIPFLRYKSGSQSPKLSRILNDLYEKEFKRWEKVGHLQDEIAHAKLEDQWDSAVYRNTGYRDEPEMLVGDEQYKTQSWTEDIYPGLSELRRALAGQASKKAKRAKDMWSIVQEEKALAAKEKAERKAAWLLTQNQVTQSTPGHLISSKQQMKRRTDEDEEATIRFVKSDREERAQEDGKLRRRQDDSHESDDLRAMLEKALSNR